MTLNLKITTWSWISIGAFLFLWCLYGITQTKISSGPFNASIIGLIYGALCLSGAVGLLRGAKWSKRIIYICSTLLILYSFSYFLMGGVLHRNFVYTSIVVLLSIIAIYSFWSMHEYNNQKL